MLCYKIITYYCAYVYGGGVHGKLSVLRWEYMCKVVGVLGEGLRITCGKLFFFTTRWAKRANFKLSLMDSFKCIYLLNQLTCS